MPGRAVGHETGDAEVLKIEDQPLVEPDEGEVRIRAAAIGLNRAEIMFRRGQYPEQPRLPSRPGYKASGVVDEPGPLADPPAWPRNFSSRTHFCRMLFPVVFRTPH